MCEQSKQILTVQISKIGVKKSIYNGIVHIDIKRQENKTCQYHNSTRDV